MKNDFRMSRRSVCLSACAVGLTGSVAGCLSGPAETEGAEQEADAAIELTDLVLVNDDEVAQTIHLLVYRNEQRVHWGTHEISAQTDSRPSIEPIEDASEGPANYSVAVRLDENTEWDEWMLKPDDGQCVEAMIRIGRDGDIGAWTMTGECEE